MLAPIARAFEQLDDPALRRVLWISLLFSAAAFALLILGAVTGLHHALAARGWLGWIAGGLGGLLAAASALWLYVPVAVLIASQLVEPICRAVERRWYPELPPPAGAGLVASTWDGLVLALRVLAANLVALLVAAILPGPGALIGWAIGAWALGRGLFAAVALRRLNRRGAAAAYTALRWPVLAQGAVLALIGTVPVLNLLLPIVGTAAMVHVLAGQPRAALR